MIYVYGQFTQVDSRQCMVNFLELIILFCLFIYLFVYLLIFLFVYFITRLRSLNFYALIFFGAFIFSFPQNLDFRSHLTFVHLKKIVRKIPAKELNLTKTTTVS